VEQLIMNHLDRRSFLTGVAASALAAPAAAVIDPPASTKKIAAIVTTYFRYSHADNIVTRFMEGYSIVGRSYPPPCRVASLYIDQAGELDIGKPLARRWKIPLAKSIGDALTLGTGRLAVDGVLIVAEHGDYPVDDRGVTLYPRKKFFEEVVGVFRASKKAVPVFNDKHLSYSWKEAKWMYDQSRELGFPMMAGSSVPGSYRRPDLKPAAGTRWQSALAVGYAHFESYGFHTLEALQAMIENRKGGETGVRAVQCLQGEAAWQAAEKGRWDAGLLEAAAALTPGNQKGRVRENDKDALVYLVEYRDGLQAAAYLSPRHFREFAFAGQEQGKTKPSACWFELPKPQRDHFSFLVGRVAQMFVTGKASDPVERTLLATGMLAFGVDSKAAGGKRIETPELAIQYGG
jgi:hypothetical protein